MTRSTSFLRKALNGLLAIAYLGIAVVVTLLTGCESLTPTRVPPLSKELGYDIPDYKGWTTTGINEGYYKIEVEKLGILRTMIDVVNTPALQAREQVVSWGNIAMSAGLFGGIPLALRKIPKGYIKDPEA